MHGPVLRAWMLESVRPATQHAERPGRWVAEPVWPPAEPHELRLYFNETGLESQPGAVSPRALCSPETTGAYGGCWGSRGVDGGGCQTWLEAETLAVELSPAGVSSQ